MFHCNPGYQGGAWRCDVCSSSHNLNDSPLPYHCYNCSYDVCQNCSRNQEMFPNPNYFMQQQYFQGQGQGQGQFGQGQGQFGQGQGQGQFYGQPQQQVQPIPCGKCRNSMNHANPGYQSGQWRCDVCKITVQTQNAPLPFHCFGCSFDVCQGCSRQIHCGKCRNLMSHCSPGYQSGQWRCDVCSTTVHTMDHPYPYHCFNCSYDVCQNCSQRMN